jgi:hypothetical protein
MEESLPTPDRAAPATERQALHRLRGVSISGGNTAAIINLPSFGTPGGDPMAPGRSPTAKGRPAFRVTTKASPRSGGAFNLYGHLPGVVYSTYFTINGFGMVSMQFADPLTADHAYTEDLTTPVCRQRCLFNSKARAS